MQDSSVDAAKVRLVFEVEPRVAGVLASFDHFAFRENFLPYFGAVLERIWAVFPGIVAVGVGIGADPAILQLQSAVHQLDGVFAQVEPACFLATDIA
jgi:hypothetical protein